MIGRLARMGLTAALALLVAGCGRDSEAPPPPVDEAPLDPAASRPTGEAGPTLQAVKARGRLNCGVHQGLVGFAYTDNRGRWRGFDVDFCRATAAAVLGDPDAVRYVPLSAAERFEALRDGRIDVLWRKDRKSTRLNSSHVKISYAVFCLKKKNNTTARKSDR